MRRTLERLLPDDWSWQAKRVLEFGCGAGRILRHFITDATGGEFWGSDIDQPSIEWGQKHLNPPLNFMLNREVPPLDFPDGKFDLIYAISVFSHLDDNWAKWLVELNRVLAPGGRIIATFMSEGMSLLIAGKPWNEREVGMAVFSPGAPWDIGGPAVLLSPWWIREHWGRLFNIEALEARNFASGEAIRGVHDHGFVVLRKTDRAVSVADLEEPHPRELMTIYAEMLRLRHEAAKLWTDGGAHIPGRAALRALGTAVKRRIRRVFEGNLR